MIGLVLHLLHLIVVRLSGWLVLPGRSAAFVLTARTEVTGQMLIFGQRHPRTVLAECETRASRSRHRRQALTRPRRQLSKQRRPGQERGGQRRRAGLRQREPRAMRGPRPAAERSATTPSAVPLTANAEAHKPVTFVVRRRQHDHKPGLGLFCLADAPAP